MTSQAPAGAGAGIVHALTRGMGPLPSRHRAALTRYRTMAYVVGVGLLILVLVGVPLEHLAHQPLVVEVVGPAHGFLYIVYLITAFDLAIRGRWPLPVTLVTLLAGTVPFLSFAVERMVTHRVTPAADGTT